ncbi:MAG: efflux RND transporter permease subunit [Candidatus Baltobacteraceae bacterium]
MGSGILFVRAVGRDEFRYEHPDERYVAIPFPQGYNMEMRGDMTEMMQSFDRLLGVMKVALLFVFLLLVVQFRSIVQPLVMLLAHQNFSTVSILGIVVANGMAVSNAIVLLDIILRKRKEGMTRRQAILYAGPVRLTPILMTTIVSVIVLAPVAFFPKTGIDAYSPLATVIIGGLAISTVLTLFVVPEWWRAHVLRRPPTVRIGSVDA